MVFLAIVPSSVVSFAAVPFAFRRPPATPAVRGGDLIGGLPYYRVRVSFYRFSSHFPGFIARPFRVVGVGFEEPHLRLVELVRRAGVSPNLP